MYYLKQGGQERGGLKNDRKSKKKIRKTQFSIKNSTGCFISCNILGYFIYRPYFVKKATTHKTSVLQEKQEGCAFYKSWLFLKMQLSICSYRRGPLVEDFLPTTQQSSKWQLAPFYKTVTTFSKQHHFICLNQFSQASPPCPQIYVKYVTDVNISEF